MPVDACSDNFFNQSIHQYYTFAIGEIRKPSATYDKKGCKTYSMRVALNVDDGNDDNGEETDSIGRHCDVDARLRKWQMSRMSFRNGA